MKTIVVSNRKGGSAKSTTAVNLSAQLAKRFNVLLIDFDTQGHASIGVGGCGVEEGGAHGIFFGKTLCESFLPTVMPSLTLSPALTQFDVYEYSDLRGVLKSRFKREHTADFFDYCIIDTAPTHDALLKNALEVADAVVIPVVPHPLGVIAVGQMFRAVYQMASQNDRHYELVAALPVMFNPHLSEHTQALSDIRRDFGEEKLFSPIGVDISLSQQFSTQKPVTMINGRCKGAMHYRKFCDELLERLGGETR